MIEFPEAATIALQMSTALQGKQIKSAIRGNAPHRFAFYTRQPEEYATILRDKKVGESVANGSMIVTSIEPGHVLVLGEGGERILFHRNDKALPQKHQLLLHFTDDTYLTVTVQGWGSLRLLEQSEAATHPVVGKTGVSPLDKAFTLEYFQSLFEKLAEQDPRSIKFFIISDPGIWGVGNGYLQDVLFRAGVHPKRRSIDVSHEEKTKLHRAIGETLKRAVELGGRDTEHDLFNKAGRYQRILNSKKAGKPCPVCGTPIEKIQYLGGTSYFCPRCQT